MTPTLGQRAKAWLPGMLTDHDERVQSVVTGTDGETYLCTATDTDTDAGEWIAEAWRSQGGNVYGYCRAKDRAPDFSDPATAGLLPYLVREAWGEPNAYVSPQGRDRTGAVPGWTCWVRFDPPHGRPMGYAGGTEVEAWIAALDAAAQRGNS